MKELLLEILEGMKTHLIPERISRGLCDCLYEETAILWHRRFHVNLDTLNRVEKVIQQAIDDQLGGSGPYIHELLTAECGEVSDLAAKTYKVRMAWLDRAISSVDTEYFDTKPFHVEPFTTQELKEICDAEG